MTDKPPSAISNPPLNYTQQFDWLKPCDECGRRPKEDIQAVLPLLADAPQTYKHAGFYSVGESEALSVLGHFKIYLPQGGRRELKMDVERGVNLTNHLSPGVLFLFRKDDRVAHHYVVTFQRFTTEQKVSDLYGGDHNRVTFDQMMKFCGIPEDSRALARSYYQQSLVEHGYPIYEGDV